MGSVNTWALLHGHCAETNSRCSHVDIITQCGLLAMAERITCITNITELVWQKQALGCDQASHLWAVSRPRMLWLQSAKPCMALLQPVAWAWAVGPFEMSPGAMVYWSRRLPVPDVCSSGSCQLTSEVAAAEQLLLHLWCAAPKSGNTGGRIKGTFPLFT